MRIRCTDDEELPIMDFASALDRAEHKSDLSTTFIGELSMATKKASAAPAPAAAAPAPAKKTKTAAAPAPETNAPEASAAVPRSVPEGHVGLNAVATELGISPAAARRKLRASDTSFKAEGQHGYYWKEGSKDLAAVKKYLTPAPEEAST